jgi:hypothetical protein
MENNMVTTIIKVLEKILDWMITGLGKASYHEMTVTEGGVVKCFKIYTIRECTIIYTDHIPN